MKRQMKDSGIEWIGQIPEEWHVSKIKNVYIVILGKMLSPSQTQKDQTLENYLCAANIKWSGVDTSIQKQMWFSESDKAEYKLHEGDILIMEGGLAGTSCKYRGEMAPCFIQNSVHCCRAKSNYSNQFLYYWMNVVYNSKYIENICNKATIQHYTKEKVMNTPFLICSSLEQEKIVSYLDRKCAQIDAIIAKQQQIIEKLKEYKLSVITEAVTKGLDPNVPMKDSGVEWIGKVPEGWIITSLRNGLSNIQTGPFGSQLHAEDYIENGIFVINPANIVDGEIIPDKKCSITNDKAAELSQHILKTGDILFARRGEMGRCAYFCDGIGRCLCGTGCIKLQCNKMLLPKFASWFLQMLGVKQYLSLHSVGTTMANLNSNIIAAIPTVLPPIKEQKQIVRYIENKMRSIQELQKKNESITKKLMDYKKSLIYEIVTGKREVF